MVFYFWLIKPIKLALFITVNFLAELQRFFATFQLIIGINTCNKKQSKIFIYQLKKWGKTAEKDKHFEVPITLNRLELQSNTSFKCCYKWQVISGRQTHHRYYSEEARAGLSTIWSTRTYLKSLWTKPMLTSRKTSDVAVISSFN